MRTPTRCRRAALVGLLPLALALAACAGAAATPAPAADGAPRDVPYNVVRQYVEGAASPRDSAVTYLTVNVDADDSGFQPATVTVPAGVQVKLVFRNRGTTEHHYRVLGLVPTDLQFLVASPGENVLADPTPTQPVANAAPADEHEHDHDHGSFSGARSLTTPGGVRVTGDRVHAWAQATGIDEVMFIAAKTGTYDVSDPRHPEITGKLIVQ